MPVSRRGLLKWGGGAAGAMAVGPLLTACGNSGSAAGGGSGLSWSSQAFFSTQSTNKAVATYLQNAVNAYQKKNKLNISLAVQSADNGAAMSKILQQVTQNRAADITEIDSYVFPLFAKHAKSVSSYLPAAGVKKEDFFPFFQPIMTGGGSGVLGLPIQTDVRMLYYRKDLIATPPSSWAEVMKIGKSLAAKGKYFEFPAGRGEDCLLCSVWPWYWSLGGQIVDPSGTKPGFASGAGYTAMLDTLGFIHQCVSSGITPKRVSTALVSDDMLPDIIGDRVGMFVGGSWVATQMQQQMGSAVSEKWAVTTIPTRSGSGFKTGSGGWMWSFFAHDTDSLKHGAQFILDTYISDEGMGRFCTAAGYLPTRSSVYDSPSFKGGLFTSDFKDSLSKYAMSRPGVAVYQKISAAMQVAMSAVASGSQSPKQALDQALSTIG
jgi:multiple sugar transport system substrate-binding protein